MNFYDYPNRLNRAGPCEPGEPTLPSLSFLSSNLTCLQNSTEDTKKPSGGPVLHSYLFTSVG